MDKNWTPEPWEADCELIIIGPDDNDWIAEFTIPVDAQRAVSCVNGCAGIPKPDGLEELVRLIKENAGVKFKAFKMVDGLAYEQDGVHTPFADALRAIGIEVDK